jgi:hypothetical protein
MNMGGKKARTDQTHFGDTDHTDNTVSSVKGRKKIRPLRETCTEPVEVSVYKGFSARCPIKIDQFIILAI